MASSFEISTPSPPSRVHTPGTPKYGYADSWEPFSPRKSARISAQRSSQRTPSPNASSKHHTRASTRTSSSDVFSTPATSPPKKRLPAMDSVRRASGALSTESSANATDSPFAHHKHKASASTSRSAMLPTPSKTPQKQPDEKAQANVRAIARNLFSTDADATPKKRKPKKYTGLTLESFTAEEIEEPIEIFTDTRDRVPDAGDNAENPFYTTLPTATEPEARKKRGRGKHVSIPGEGKQSIDEALQRDDGIVYVFRGKKIFRKFSSSEDLDSASEADDEVDAELGSAKESRQLRALARSSIKPRLLFPTPSKGKEVKEVEKTSTEDEEAVTDIEDHVLGDVEEEDQMEVPETPKGMATKKPETPVAPRFAPASPPSTVRATRASTRLNTEETPIRPSKPRSPFDSWRRSKGRAGGHGQKREGEALAGQNVVSKRQRA
ncbi:hypothetical protein F5Y04DRAFT_172272 [Hypomontagnella monticulosa]|nr:hypothetical protein F5Y04DRAFT_172272 [Hypomontagnella monticulosa]